MVRPVVASAGNERSVEVYRGRAEQADGSTVSAGAVAERLERRRLH